jgi:Enoyl-(Acyl carrier protein) reductase
VITESAAALSRDTGRECLAFQVDVRDPESITRAVEQTVAQFGKLDFVINGPLTNCASMNERAAQNLVDNSCCWQLSGTVCGMPPRTSCDVSTLSPDPCKCQDRGPHTKRLQNCRRD